MVNWTFVELDEAASTQSVARDLAAGGAPEGTTVVAKSQSSGAGRLDRAWASPPGGLYMSFILRPSLLPRPELAAIVAAAAVTEGIRSASGLETKIRWPNDIMVSGKKLGGVIAHAESSGDAVTSIIVGVGVNCNVSISEVFGITDATSLAEQQRKPVEIPTIRGAILKAFSFLYRKWQQGTDMAPLWKHLLSTVGANVLVKLKTDETPFAAVAKDVDEEGALIVEHGGNYRRITPEDLEWLREQS